MLINFPMTIRTLVGVMIDLKTHGFDLLINAAKPQVELIMIVLKFRYPRGRLTRKRSMVRIDSGLPISVIQFLFSAGWLRWIGRA